MHYEIVIAGGGFAGAYCAQTLGRLLGASAQRRVALISERNVLVFHPMLAEVAGSALAPRDVVHPLREMCRHVDVLQGSILKVDAASKSLTLDGGRFTRNHVVTFDHLVLALGNVTDLSRMPGMSEYGWPMKSVADALRLRAALINRLEEANLVEDPVVRARLLTFVVVGGGYTGVETAGQIGDLLHQAHPLYANLKSTAVKVILVHSRPHLLEEIGPELGDYAQRVLEKNHIEVRLQTRVAEVTSSKVIFDDGTFLEAHSVIATIGSAPHPVALDLARQCGFPSERGRIQVSPTMQVVGQTHFWAIGDGAAVPWVDRGETKVAPPTAQLALRQGQQLARNLHRVLAGRTQELKPFTYRYQGQLATVGEREAVAEVFGLRFSGFIAWWLWRTIYLAKLPGMLRRLRVMIDWTFDLVFPRDISLTQPPPDDILRSIHLEKGEVLVQAGHHVRAFYFLKKGQLAAEPAGEVLGNGAIIDQAWTNGDQTWRVTLRAVESSDVVVIRSRAFALLRDELQLVRRT